MNDLLHSNKSGNLRVAKWAGITFSLPSWVLITTFVLYRIWDGALWPNLTLFAIPGCICMVCSLIAMTIFLITMNESPVSFLDIFGIMWAAFPILISLIFMCVVWYSINFGDSYSGDYWQD